MKFIEVDKITYSYPGDEEGTVLPPALKEVCLSIKKGSFVAVLGHNGSGKSTLAKQFNALLIPDSGDLWIKDMNTKDEKDLWNIRSSCGMVFQNPDNQLVSSVVEDDVAFGPENLGIAPLEIRKRVDDALNAVGMYEHRKKGPHLLSGGQKQRIAIAGVIAMGTDIIVFDEPTAMLDPKGRSEIMEIIHQLHEDGKTIILITHFMEEALQADRIIVMNDGNVAMDGTPREIFLQEERLADYHIELPFAAALAKKLRERGMDVPKDIFTEDELEQYLCALK